MNFQNERMKQADRNGFRTSPTSPYGPVVLQRLLASLSINGVHTSSGIIVVPVFPVCVCRVAGR